MRREGTGGLVIQLKLGESISFHRGEFLAEIIVIKRGKSRWALLIKAPPDIFVSRSGYDGPREIPSSNPPPDEL